ncbi:hypothetical protein MUP05_01675 [Candidatus Bathyarchaeota archaeon]|nr:hypothetical protein [Candidatus Bathyarchaeota archaeon]
MQRYELRANMPIGDRTLITLRTEVVKLFNLMTIVKSTIGNLREFDEIKELPISRLEDAHRTLKSFVEQYEKRRQLNKERN